MVSDYNRIACMYIGHSAVLLEVILIRRGEPSRTGQALRGRDGSLVSCLDSRLT